MATLALAIGAAGLGSAAAGVGAVSLLQAGLSEASGRIAEKQIEQQAFQQGIASKDRELERRRQSLRVLAAQNVTQAASGLTGTGSAAVVREQSALTAERDLTSLRAQAAGTQSSLRAQARNARTQGRIGAISSLISGGSQIYGAVT